MNEPAQNGTEQMPAATVEPARRRKWVWLIPLAAVVLAAGLVTGYVVKRGPVITVTMAHGHGLKPKDVLRCRGIVIGQIESVKLSSDLESIEVAVRLDPTARHVARQGSRFWVVRPRVDLTGVAGLDTITGPRYLAVRPGDGDRQSTFVALAEPPAVDRIDPDGLEIELIADRRHSLRSGAPILYRQMRIGTVLSVGLSIDAASVEIRAYVEPAFAPLVRDNSQFWNVSGVDFDLDLTGLSLDVESLQSLLDGGVAMATPNPPGQRVATGHRFTLSEDAEDNWLLWRPEIWLH